ncbi:MAG: diguanylate cyclase domain-containing protein [Bradymonadia bacterium]
MPSAAQNTLNVLLVEDHDVDALIVRRALSSTPRADAICISRLADLPPQPLDDRFDVCLLDLGLPSSQGLTTVHRALHVLDDTPIIVLTGHSDDTLGEEAMDIGAQDYLLKGEIKPETLSRSMRYAISRSRRMSHMKRSAFYDHLTGLPNRSLLESRLEHALRQRDMSPLCVCFVDLNGFKTVNDTYGHAAGDEVLVQVGQIISNLIRSGDTAARLGGDEFVCLFEGIADQEAGLALANRLRSAIAQHYSVHVDGQTCSVEVGASVGLAFYPWDGHSAEQLLQMADQAMYAAKRGGGYLIAEASGTHKG